MNTNKSIKLAVKKHDEDAMWFQNQYETNGQNKNLAFLYGRTRVLNELNAVLAKLPKGARILDVGSGTGHLTKSIKEMGFEVVGIEPSLPMLELAKLNFPDIEFKHGYSHKLPFEDKQFDFILAFEVLRYLSKDLNSNTYGEFNRVLKPGGKFFATHVNLFSSDFYLPFYYLKGLVYKLTNKSYFNCYFTTPSKESTMVKKAGFKNVDSVGLMTGYIRIGYKLGAYGFKVFRSLAEKFNIQQRYADGVGKSTAGHLVLIAEK